MANRGLRQVNVYLSIQSVIHIILIIKKNESNNLSLRNYSIQTLNFNIQNQVSRIVTIQLIDIMQKQELSKLLQQSNSVTQDLMELRNAILNQNVSSHYQPTCETIQNGIYQRSHLRTLAETLEANRNLLQISKQKIEKSRIVLEGLDYFKKTLKEKIQGYQINVDSIDNYFQEPIGSIDWLNKYQQGEEKLKGSLERLRAKDQQLQETIKKKNELVNAMKQKNKLYNSDMPRQIKKLNEQVIETTKLFGIQTSEVLEKIESPQLAYIYDALNNLRSSERIQIHYSKEQHQFIDLIIKPASREIYEKVNQFGIKLQEKQLKLKISYIEPELNKLVIGIDRRSNFSNKQIFHRLVKRDEARLVFDQPSNQSQRNINNRYIYLDNLEDILCNSTSKVSLFLELIRKRAFIVAFVKNIFENIKNPSWLNLVSPSVYSQFVSRRFCVQFVQKISFNEFKGSVFLPNSVKKSLNSYEQEIRKQGNQVEGVSESRQNMRKNKNKLLQVLGNYGLQELIIPDIYHYYRLALSFKGWRVVCIIMIAYQYPDIAPKIKILNIEKEDNDTSSLLLPQSIQCRARVEDKILYSRQIASLERQLNQPLPFAKQGVNQQFRIIFYLSRIFESISSIQSIYNERRVRNR